MKASDLPGHDILDDKIRHAVSEIYLTAKHARKENRLDDQEYQLIIAKLSQIEAALRE